MHSARLHLRSGRGMTFELQAHLNEIPTRRVRHSCRAGVEETIFTESLILAQDERWRRA
jgi:hypothetical protein